MMLVIGWALLAKDKELGRQPPITRQRRQHAFPEYVGNSFTADHSPDEIDYDGAHLAQDWRWYDPMVRRRARCFAQ